MIAVLLILIPFISGLAGFFIRAEKGAKNWAVLSSLITAAIGVYALSQPSSQVNFDCAWLPTLGARFSLHMDGMSKMLALLTSVAMPLVFISTIKNNYSNAGNFYGLMLLTQAGMMGVFLASDLLLFY